RACGVAAVDPVHHAGDLPVHGQAVAPARPERATTHAARGNPGGMRWMRCRIRRAALGGTVTANRSLIETNRLRLVPSWPGSSLVDSHILFLSRPKGEPLMDGLEALHAPV